MANELMIAYGPEYLDWQLGPTHPTNPERALIATELLEKSLGKEVLIVPPHIEDYDIEALGSVHDPEYVHRVVLGESSEWDGVKPEVGMAALHMFAGTARLVEKMLAGDVKVAFNPQGAKHHAGYNYGSGFCVFNDMAWAAKEFMAAGMTVLYIDWDAHHGDGVEFLLEDTAAYTCSIHEGGIFPGTGNEHNPTARIYNWPLDHHAGGNEFQSAMDEIVALADEIKPDVVLLATGADAHINDPLSNLRFEFSDYKIAAFQVADIAIKHAGGRVLIGGAGGYQPLTNTPMIWAQVVSDIYKMVEGDIDVSEIRDQVLGDDDYQKIRIREFLPSP